MNRDETLRLALKAGIDVAFGAAVDRFAAVIAAAEREACAEVVDASAAACRNNPALADVLAGSAAAIRARGEK